MTELWNPWGTQESNLFEMWLQAGILAGVVDENRINYMSHGWEIFILVVGSFMIGVMIRLLI